MNKKKIFGFVCLSGCLFLPVIQICATETTESQQQSFNILKQTIQKVTEVVNVDNFTDHMFLDLEEDDIVFQVNGGGFLYSKTDDPETLIQSFIENNGAVELEATTVSEAKEFYKTQLDNAITSAQQE